MSPTPAQRACAARLAAQIAELTAAGFILPGTLTDDQLADYQPWFDNQRRLHALITELETLSQEIADNDPRWQR